VSGWWGLVWCVLLVIFLYVLARGDGGPAT